MKPSLAILDPAESFETAAPAALPERVVGTNGEVEAMADASDFEAVEPPPAAIPRVMPGHRTLPHSLEAEEHLLSVILLDGADVLEKCAKAKLRPDSFYDPKHGTIYETLQAMRAADVPIDASTLAQELKDRRQLDQVGGYAFIAQVSSRVPTTAQASYFISKVSEQATLREIIRAATTAVEDCYDYTGDLPALTDDLRRRLTFAATGRISAPVLVASKFSDFELPPPGDDSILIGDRWICRGDSVIISSTSGMGKSSLALQMAVCWALCLPFMGGLKPARPLRSLFLQAEDSDGDIAEVKLSIFHEMKLSPADQALVGERVLIITDRIHRGESFLMELRTKVELHKPDFVWINPLLAFLDGDINEAQAAGKFLREGLNSINHPPRFAYCTIHHTAKPPKEKQDRKWNEVMYDMAGSSDLTNWARAIISLRPNETEGEFTMVFAKRGYRAGYKKKVPGKINPGMLFDEPTITIGVKHSKERMQVNGHDLRVIFWEPCPLPGESDTKRMGRPRVAEFEDFNSMWPTSQDASKGFRQLHRLATEIKPTIGRSAFSRIIEDAVEAQKLVIDSRVPGQPKYYTPPLAPLLPS